MFTAKVDGKIQFIIAQLYSVVRNCNLFLHAEYSGVQCGVSPDLGFLVWSSTMFLCSVGESPWRTPLPRKHSWFLTLVLVPGVPWESSLGLYALCTIFGLMDFTDFTQVTHLQQRVG